MVLLFELVCLILIDSVEFKKISAKFVLITKIVCIYMAIV